jgi:hypothetical protein
VRKELRAQALIEDAEHTFTRLEKLNLTKAQREDAIIICQVMSSSLIIGRPADLRAANSGR